jgi:hypothetical protein
MIEVNEKFNKIIPKNVKGTRNINFNVLKNNFRNSLNSVTSNVLKKFEFQISRQNKIEEIKISHNPMLFYVSFHFHL